MKRIVPLLVVLVLAGVAYAQSGFCGDGIVQSLNTDLIVEQCDDGNLVDGDGCSSTCQLEKDAGFVGFDLGMAHNLLFSKVQDLLHIIKHSLFQAEIKQIEMQLTEFSCDSMPVSFWMPASVYPYGKLEEIDALIELDIQSVNDNPDSEFGDIDTGLAESLLAEADECISDGEYRTAFECKCLAYRNGLLELNDTSVTCSDPCGGIVV